MLVETQRRELIIRHGFKWIDYRQFGTLSCLNNKPLAGPYMAEPASLISFHFHLRLDSRVGKALSLCWYRFRSEDERDIFRERATHSKCCPVYERPSASETQPQPKAKRSLCVYNTST